VYFAQALVQAKVTKSIYDLDDEEVAIVGQCLVAAVDGSFFPDWEFEILMGRSRDEVRLVAATRT
jgi:hypothetical protein